RNSNERSAQLERSGEAVAVKRHAVEFERIGRRINMTGHVGQRYELAAATLAADLVGHLHDELVSRNDEAPVRAPQAFNRSWSLEGQPGDVFAVNIEGGRGKEQLR